MILTPHIGGSTAEAQANIGPEVAEKLVKYSDNGTSVSSVNFPEVALPSHPQASPAAHPPEHSGRDERDQQGLRRQRHQHLRPVPADQREVGYVVIDVDKEYPTPRWKSCSTSTAPSAVACCSDAAKRSSERRLRPPFSFPQPSLGTQSGVPAAQHVRGRPRPHRYRAARPPDRS